MSSGHLIFIPVSRGLRVKVTLGIVLPLVLILGAFTTIEFARHQKAVFTNLSFLASQIGQVIENGIQHEMLTQNPQGLQHMLDAIGQDRSIRIVYLLDTSGRVVFAPEGTGVGTRLDNRDSTCQPCHRLPAAERPGSVVVTLAGGQRVFRSMNPIENQPACHACHNPGQRLIGLLLTDISMAPLEAPLKADLREYLLWWAGTILVTVLIVNLAMSRLVIHRLEGVAQALASFGRGNLDLRLATDSADEIGQLASAFNLMGQRIQIEEAENRALSENLRHHVAQQREMLKRLITAQEDERKRVARELHDELGQALAGLALQVKILEYYINSDGGRAQEQLNQIRALITQTSDRMYDLIMALRPSVLDDLGLAAAIRAYTDQLLRGSGIDFQLNAGSMSERLPPDLETALYRIIQEALNNILRHAKAKKVSVKLSRTDNIFEAEILDDGQGFIPETVRTDGLSSRGLGLLGMQERITQCGGDLEIVSQPGSGTCIRIHVPLKETCFD